jgi:Transcriptional regulator
MTPATRGQDFLKRVAETGKVEEPGDRRYRLDIIAAPELLKSNVKPVWAIKRILVAGQPLIIGGAKKTLKTSVAIDMAISLATGTSFLNRNQFAVPKKLRVCLFSGESGEATVQETIRRQLATKEFRQKDNTEVLKNLYVGFKLPQFSVEKSLDELDALLGREKFDVLIVDPLYLCLLYENPKAQASNIFDMGPLLLKLTETCLKHGTTPVLLHHFIKNRNSKNEAPELDDFAFAGPAEFARQWILLARREKFPPGTGIHKLWLVVGGSVGFSGCWAVDIDEGSLKDDFTGRTWGVEIRTQSEEIELQRAQNEQKKRVKAAETAEKDKSDCREIVRYLTQSKEGDSLSAIAREVGIGRDRARKLLDGMVDEGTLEHCEIQKRAGNNKKGTPVQAYRLVETESAESCTDEEHQAADDEETIENLDDEDDGEEPGEE